MSGPVPTLGYRSKSQAAAAMRDRGLTYGEIARKVDVSPEVARKLIRSGRRANGAPRRPTSGAAEVPVMLGASTVEALTRAAEARGSSVALLAAKLLTHAARDNLITAILDDGGKP